MSVYRLPLLAALLVLHTTGLFAADTGVSSDLTVAPGTTTIEADIASADDISEIELEWQNLEQQIDVGELREARGTLESRIDEMQKVGDRYDVQLVRPLSLLGRIYHEQKDYPRAAETFAQATQISRIANGLHSGEQLELVHKEIASLKAMGNIVEANRRHEYAFSIATRHYGRFARQLIPELLKIGNWYTSTGDIIGARGRFSDARVLLSANQDTAQSDLMILALRGLAKSYRDERYPPFYERPDQQTRDLFERNGLNDRQDSVAQLADARLRVNAMHRGTEALVDVLRIQGNRLLAQQEALLRAAAPDQTNNAEPVVVSGSRRRGESLNLDAIQAVVQSAEVDKSDFLKAMLELGDWYLLMNQEPRAFAWYQQAYTIAEADPNTDAAALLGEPKLLYFPRPKDPRVPERLPRKALEQGHVAVQFDIDHRGNIKRLKTVQSQPKGMMDFPVRASAKISRYRPRIVAGLPQPTAAYAFTHSFSYFPRDKKVPENVINSDEQTQEPLPEPAPKRGDSPTTPTASGR